MGGRDLQGAVGDELSARAPAFAPDLLTLEVVSSLTRIVRAGALTRAESGVVLDAYATLPIARHPSHPLWRRIAELAVVHSAYDAAYVALAEALDAPLLTTDSRLAGAVSGVEVVCPV